jgi:predicted  nucleic acid-binding Zn-ribbon protein
LAPLKATIQSQQELLFSAEQKLELGSAEISQLKEKIFGLEANFQASQKSLSETVERLSQETQKLLLTKETLTQRCTSIAELKIEVSRSAQDMLAVNENLA